MRLSKLQANLLVLKVVKRRSPTTIDEILGATKLGRIQLELSLETLVENFLVAEQIVIGNATTYKITERGKRVLKFFGISKLAEDKGLSRGQNGYIPN